MDSIWVISVQKRKREWKEKPIWRKNTEKFLNVVEDIYTDPKFKEPQQTLNRKSVNKNPILAYHNQAAETKDEEKTLKATRDKHIT